MIDLILSLGDTVTVRGESTPNYRATIEAINGDRITVRPLPNQNMTTRARAINRQTILGIVTKSKPNPPAVTPIEPASPKAPLPEASPDDDLTALRAEVALCLKTNFPEAAQAWINGWRAACTRILTRIDKRIDKRDAAQPTTNGTLTETNGIAAE